MGKGKPLKFLTSVLGLVAFIFPAYGQMSPCDSVIIRFDFNSSTVSGSSASGDLEQFIESVKSSYNDGRLQQVTISGSSCLIGTNVSCTATALRRAENLRDYIIRHSGIPAGLVTITEAGIDWNMLAALVREDPGTPKGDIVVKTITDTPLWIFDSDNHVVDGRKKQMMEIYYGRSFVYMRKHFFSDMRYASAYLFCNAEEQETAAPMPAGQKTALEEEEIVEETDAFAPETTAAEVSEDIDTAAYSEPATVAISTTPVRKEMTWEGSKVWLKTNIPYWALVVANLGVEVRLSDHWSLDIPVMYSPYTIAPTYRFRIFAVQPSARYWLKPDMTGHFFGIHATGGMFNISVNDTQRFQDINGAWGGGIDYGYALKFSKHWGMEFNIGIGYLWSRYETFYNIENGVSYNEATLNYFGITRLGISLIYKL